MKYESIHLLFRLVLFALGVFSITPLKADPFGPVIQSPDHLFKVVQAVTDDKDYGRMWAAKLILAAHDKTAFTLEPTRCCWSAEYFIFPDSQ